MIAVIAEMIDHNRVCLLKMLQEAQYPPGSLSCSLSWTAQQGGCCPPVLPLQATYPRRHRAWSAGHQTNGLDAGRAGVDNARDRQVVEVVGVEWELQRVSDIQLTV